MSYYYLIAGLPDLQLGMDTHKIDFDAVVETIQRNLEPADEQQFQYLLYTNDNRNLLNTLWQKYKGFPVQNHIWPCTINKEELQDYRRQQGAFPLYMAEFISIYEDQFPNMSAREMEDRLWEGFYEELNAQSPFIKKYLQFEQKLKDIVAAYNASFYDFLTAPVNVDESILSQVGKGRSATPSLQREHAYIEALGEKIAAGQPHELEGFIRQIKWDYLNEVKNDFSGEQVFAYTLRLLLVLDTHLQNSDKGQSRFVELQKNIKSKIDSPIISMI